MLHELKAVFTIAVTVILKKPHRCMDVFYRQKLVLKRLIQLHSFHDLSLPGGGLFTEEVVLSHQFQFSTMSHSVQKVARLWLKHLPLTVAMLPTSHGDVS